MIRDQQFAPVKGTKKRDFFLVMALVVSWLVTGIVLVTQPEKVGVILPLGVSAALLAFVYVVWLLIMKYFFTFEPYVISRRFIVPRLNHDMRLHLSQEDLRDIHKLNDTLVLFQYQVKGVGVVTEAWDMVRYQIAGMRSHKTVDAIKRDYDQSELGRSFVKSQAAKQAAFDAAEQAGMIPDKEVF